MRLADANRMGPASENTSFNCSSDSSRLHLFVMVPGRADGGDLARLVAASDCSTGVTHCNITKRDHKFAGLLLQAAAIFLYAALRSEAVCDGTVAHLERPQPPIRVSPAGVPGQKQSVPLAIFERSGGAGADSVISCPQRLAHSMGLQTGRRRCLEWKVWRTRHFCTRGLGQTLSRESWRKRDSARCSVQMEQRRPAHHQ